MKIRFVPRNISEVCISIEKVLILQRGGLGHADIAGRSLAPGKQNAFY
jgi:hypothetical protein